MTMTAKGVACWCWCDQHGRFELYTAPPGVDLALTAVFALGGDDLPPGAELWPLPPEVTPALDLARAGAPALRLVLDAGVDALNAVMAAAGYRVPPLPPVLRAVPVSV